MATLVGFEKNFFSENGEDGILFEIFQRIGRAAIISEKSDNSIHWTLDFFCEFGAWDGKSFSNSWNLASKSNWGGLFIESDKKKFSSLLNNCKELHGDISCQNVVVDSEGINSLDNILAQNRVPRYFALLSIDIDGNDFHVWKSLDSHFPAVVVIEYNFTIPIGVFFTQENRQGVSIGSSASSLRQLGSEKGYILVAATKTNLIFVRNEFSSLFDVLEDELIPVSAPVHVWTGYDGSLHFSETITLQWHPIYIKDGVIQVLPKYIRQFSANYNFVQILLFRLIRFYWRFRNRSH